MTPTDEMREAVARAISTKTYALLGSSDDCGEWEEMSEKARNVYRTAADAALSALAPIRAQEIAAARAEEQGYRHTQVAALKQVHAAEILAARTSGRNDATDEREAVAQWCSGCHEVRSVDCYRAGCPKSDTERRAAEILAARTSGRNDATEDREAVARAEQAERSCVLIALWAEYRAQSSEKLPVTIDDAHSRHRYLVSAFADAALSALAPIRAAEILAAEANERARLLSDAAIEAAREYLAICGHEPISDIFIEGAIKEAIKAGERNEHGAGK